MKIFLSSILLLLSVLSSSAEEVSAVVTGKYKYDPDGRACRLLYLKSENELTSVLMSVEGQTEELLLKDCGEGRYELLLPEGTGVKCDAKVCLSFYGGFKYLGSSEVTVPRVRHWRILIFPHSHVDIGYTHTQEIVQFIHKRNLEQAIILGEKTSDYPEGSRFVWNAEVAWPVERYLATESPENCKRLIDGIRNGYISVDASYVNTNTSAAHEAELLELFSPSHRIAAITGMPSETMIQVDIPGVSWGIPALADLTGVKYFISLPNESARVGFARKLDFKPKMWLGPDGKSKVFFIQPGPYTAAACFKRESWFWDYMGQSDTSKLPLVISSDNPRDNFMDDFLDKSLPVLENDEEYIYDVYPMSWCMSDNVPIDADLPEAVRSWNEEYAYPKLSICSSKEIIDAYKPYFDRIPVVSGDYSEYWTDGLGSSAVNTGKHREAKEKISQAELLALMTGSPLPSEEVDDAWRNAILGTEHTWGYIWPEKPEADVLFSEKFHYFKVTDSLASDLMSKALSSCRKPDSKVIAVFNTESFSRGGMVKVSPELLGDANSVIDMDSDRRLPSQMLSDGSLAFLSAPVAPYSCKKYKIVRRRTHSPKEEKVSWKIDNSCVSVALDSLTGDIASLVRDGREFVGTGYSANSFRYILGGQTLGQAVGNGDVKVRWKEWGPVLKTLSVESSAPACNSLTREITLISSDSAVYVRDIIDKLAVTEKEGVHFGFGFNLKGNVRFSSDVPWGYMQLERDQWPEANRNWMSMQRWMNVSDDNANVTVCSLNAPVFEAGGITANVMGAGDGQDIWNNSIEMKPVLWSWVMNNHWFTNFPLSQEGKVCFNYVLDASEGSVDPVKAALFAQSYCRPLIVCPVDRDFLPEPMFNIKADPSVTVACTKTLNEGNTLLVFLRSLSESVQNCEIILPSTATACESNAWGEPQAAPSSIFRIGANSATVVRIDF